MASLEKNPENGKIPAKAKTPMVKVMKVMGIFMSMDNMIGNDFAAGLANLKAVAEKQ